MPRLHGFVAGTDIEVGLRLDPSGRPDIKAERDKDQQRFDEMIAAGSETLFLFERAFEPPQYEMSRFMAKMALEVHALRFSHDVQLLDRLIDDPHYDRIRNWARRGGGAHEWPYHKRQIFPEETLMRHPATGEWVQAGYSHDLFLTKRRETFFAFSLFGHEFVMNVGGPAVRGYSEWLEQNNFISPLVERAGFKLQRRAENGKEAFYLIGQNDGRIGVEFDRANIGLADDE